MSGFKVLGVILLAIADLILAQLLALGAGEFAVSLGGTTAVSNILTAVLYIALVFFGVVFLCKKILKISPEVFRITKPSLKPVWLLAAFSMPLLVSGVMILTVPGHFESSNLSRIETFNVLTGAIFFIGLGAGIVEELIFRGMIMSALELRFGRRIAIVIPSVIFGLLHIQSGMEIFSVIQLIIAGTVIGILFSLITCATGSIWSSAAMHTVWNALTTIIHIGIEKEETAVVNYILNTNSFLISGGDFGIESGIISIIVYILFCIPAAVMLKNGSQTK